MLNARAEKAFQEGLKAFLQARRRVVRQQEWLLGSGVLMALLLAAASIYLLTERFLLWGVLGFALTVMLPLQLFKWLYQRPVEDRILQVYKESHLEERLVRMLQRSTLTTLDFTFTFADYSHLKSEVQDLQGSFTVITYWLTPGRQLVEVDLMWYAKDGSHLLVPMLRDQARLKRLLEGDTERYLEVFGGPKVVV